MYATLIIIHSVLRYVVFVLLVVVIAKSLSGWFGKKPFSKGDDKISLFLLIFTHTQFLVGLFLYFVSPYVQFSGSTMRDASLRYWTVEHVFMMLIAIALITVARITHKKLATDDAKFKRLFYLNAIALLIIVAAIQMSHRGLLTT